MEEPLICSCGNTVFYEQYKKPHLGLYCNQCNKWKKWVQQDAAKLFFGKYKDKYVSQVKDIDYLEFILENVRVAKNTYIAIEKQIEKLKNQQ